MRRITLVFLLLLLTACTAQTAVEPTVEATAVPVPPTAPVATEVVIEPTAVPTSPPVPTDEPAQPEPTALPPTEPAPAEEAEVAEVVVEYGRTEEGAFFKGAAGAPVTLIDYSDFL